MLTPQDELPGLFDSAQDRGKYKATLVEVLSNHLHKKWKGTEQRQWEDIRSKFKTIGQDHDVQIGTVLVESKNAHFFLSGKYTLEQLMSSTVVLVDRAVDWSKVIVEMPNKEQRESGPDYVVLNELLATEYKLGEDGYVIIGQVPEFVKDEEYYKRRGELVEIKRLLDERDRSVNKALSLYGLSSLSNIVGIRVGEIGKRYLGSWFDSLEGKEIGLRNIRLASVTLGVTEPMYPKEMKGRVLFTLDTQVGWRVKMLRVLDPIVYVVSKKLIHNRVRETKVGFEPDTHPERIEKPQKAYLIYKNHFKILEKAFLKEVSRIDLIGSLLSVNFEREFRDILLYTLNEVLETGQEMSA